MTARRGHPKQGPSGGPVSAKKTDAGPPQLSGVAPVAKG